MTKSARSDSRRDLIYLCHKCEGVLAGAPPAPTYGCHCMSGWIRDWQHPTPPDAVLDIQIRRQRDWLALYARQGRSAAACKHTCDLLTTLEAAQALRRAEDTQ